MKKLYLHMGFHKTATTSFQQTCKKNMGLLENQGFHYPIFNSLHITRKDIENHSIPIYSVFCETPAKYHINIRQKVENTQLLNEDYLSQLKKCFAMDKNIILSGEDISLLSISSLQELKIFLSNFNYEIIPIVVIRSPYEFHCSVIQTHITIGNSINLLNFSSRIAAIKNIKEVFEDVTMYPFRMTLEHNHGPVGFLYEKMGIDYENFEFVKANEGRSNIYVRMQNELNKTEPVIKSGALNPQHKKITIKYNNYFKAKFLLTKDEYDTIKKDCDKENTFFKEFLGEEFCDKDIKFSELSNILKEFSNVIVDMDTISSQEKLQLRKQIQNSVSKLKAENSELRHKLTQALIEKSSFQAIKNIIFQLLLKKKAFSLCNSSKIYEAEAIAQNIIANNPYISWAYYILGKCQWEQGLHKLALENVQKAIDLDPNIEYYKTYLNSRKPK